MFGHFYRLLVVIVFISSTNHTSAKDIIKSSADFISFSKKNFADTIKVNITDGAVIVPVEIEGMKKHLLFDTGSPLGLWIGEKENWMKQITTDSLYLGDINKKQRNQIIYQVPTIKLGDLSIESYPMIVDDAMSGFICNRFDGVIGFNLVGKGLSFKLDTKDSLLIITDIKDFFADENKGYPTAKYKMKQFYHPSVIVDTPLGSLETVFDTGALNTWYDLPQEYLERWFQKSPKISKVLDNLTIQTDTTIRASVGIYGLDIDTLVGRFLHFPTIKIGKLPVNDLYVTTTHKTSRIGSAILKHMSLIIDASRQQFVFQPHDKQNITVSNSEIGSISLIPTEADDTLGVLKAFVRKGSDVYRQGVRTGDYLIEINGTPISDLCSYLLMEHKHEETSLKFRSKNGIVKLITLRIPK